MQSLHVKYATHVMCCSPGYRPFQLLMQPHFAILKDIKPQTSSSLSSSTSSLQRNNMTKGSGNFSPDEGSSQLNRNCENDVASPLKCNRDGADGVEMSRVDQENSSDKGCAIS